MIKSFKLKNIFLTRNQHNENNVTTIKQIYNDMYVYHKP